MYVSLFPPPFLVNDKKMRISKYLSKKYVNLGVTLKDKTRNTLEIYIETSNFIFIRTAYRWF